jgi:hypothetical protein
VTGEQNVWKPYLEGRSVVLLGSLNPPILQPAWFAAKGLIGESEAEKAEDLLVTNEVTTFATDWLTLEATRERLTVSTSNPARYVALRDLLVGTFRLLEHTPFGRMGINELAHYQMASEEKWHAFGDYLTPKGPWEGHFEGRVGMRSLIIEAKRPNCSAKYIRVKVEPSIRAQPGVFFEINEHYETKEAPGTSVEFLRILEESWEEAGSFARRLETDLLNQEY